MYINSEICVARNTDDSILLIQGFSRVIIVKAVVLSLKINENE